MTEMTPGTTPVAVAVESPDSTDTFPSSPDAQGTFGHLFLQKKFPIVRETSKISKEELRRRRWMAPTPRVRKSQMLPPNYPY